MIWPQELKDVAMQMWKEGHSATYIAAALNCGLTRNAVLGMLFRAGQTGRGQPTTAMPRRAKRETNAAPRKRRAPRPEISVVGAAPRPPKPALNSKPIHFLDMPSRGRCKYPLWPDMESVPFSEKTVCGGDCENVYCDFHDRLCTEPVERRRHRAALIAAGTIAA